MRNLILADNQDITNAGIQFIVERLQIIGSVFLADKKANLISLLSDNQSSIIVLDYTLFDFGSIDELQILNERYPESSWILFSDELSDVFLRQMIANDLSFSIVLKLASFDEIKSAIDYAYDYKCFISEGLKGHLKILNKTIHDFSENNLTATEKEILKEIALGKTTKEIAADRFLSFHTIMTHRKNIFRKLEVNNAHEATKYAMRAGIVDVSEYYI